MKSVTNRALWAKKLYSQPSVECAQVLSGSMVMAGSPGINVGNEPIDPNEGGD